MRDCLGIWKFRFLLCSYAVLLVVLVKEGCTSAPAKYLISPICHSLQEWKQNILPGMKTDIIHHFPDGGSMRVNGSVRLFLVNNPTLFDSDEVYICKVSFIAAHRYHRILLSWSYMEVGTAQGGTSWVHVLDSESEFDLSGPMWGQRERVSDFHSIGEGLTLAYRGHPAVDEISVIFTEFRDTNSNGSCEPGSYKCAGLFHYCIAGWLHCDGYNNCGSTDSDETNDCQEIVNDPLILPRNGSSVGLVGALLGILVTILLVTAVGISIYICKRRMMLRRGWHPHSGCSSHPRGLHALSQPLKIPAPENQYGPAPSTNLALHPTVASHQPGHPAMASGATNGFILEPVVSYITDDDYSEIPSEPVASPPAGQPLMACNPSSGGLQPTATYFTDDDYTEIPSAPSSVSSNSAGQPLIPRKAAGGYAACPVVSGHLPPVQCVDGHIYTEPEEVSPESSVKPCLSLPQPPLLRARGQSRQPPSIVPTEELAASTRPSAPSSQEEHLVLMDLDRPVGQQVVLHSPSAHAAATPLKPDNVPCGLSV